MRTICCRPCNILSWPGPADGADGRRRAQYQWFVGYLLTVSEEILLIDPSPAWREVLARQFAPHRAFLTSQTFLDGPYRGLTKEVRGLIAEAAASMVARTTAGPDAAARETRRA